MGYKQIRTSDISGTILEDDNVVTVVIRSHPDLQEGKIFDAASEELSGLKTVDNLVALEVPTPDGKASEIVVSKTDFAKVVSADKLAAFDSVRGRRTGFKPNGNGS